MKAISKLINTLYNIDARIWLAVVVLVTLFVRTYKIGNESIYGDEAYSIFFALQPISESLGYFLKDTNPPLYNFILHFWITIFGISAISVKMLSVIFSVSASAVLFLFTNKFINKTTAILVSVLFLLCNAQQYFATETRAYALTQLLCISSFYVYFSLLTHPRIKHIFFLIVLNLALLFTHYLTFFIFVIQFAGILFYIRKNRKAVFYYFISQISAALLFIPWLKIVIAAIPKTGKFWVKVPDYTAFRWHTVILTGNTLLYYFFNSLVILFLILFLGNRRKRIFVTDFNTNYFFIFLFLYLFPIVFSFIVSQYTPVFLTRYFLYSLFGLFLFIAYSFGKLNIKKTLKLKLAIPFLLILCFSFNITQIREDDWKQAVPEINSFAEPNTIIYISAFYKYREFSYYYDREVFKDYKNGIERLAKKNVFVTPAGETKGWEKLDLNSVKKIIYVQSHSEFEDSLNEIKPFFIHKGFTECDCFQNGQITFSVLLRDTIQCNPVKIISISNSYSDNLFRKYTGLTEKNDTVDIYKATFDSLNTVETASFITKELSYSGNYSFRVNDETKFSLIIKKQRKELLGKKRIVRISAYVNCEEGNDGLLAISAEKYFKTLFRNEIHINQKITNNNKWQKIKLDAYLPDTIDDDATVKIYFWNPAKKNIFADDFTIEVF